MACLQHFVAGATPLKITATTTSSRVSSSDVCFRNVLGPIDAHRRLAWRSSIGTPSGDGPRRKRWQTAAAADDEEDYLTDLRVPQAWISPGAAAEEAEWLRGALHKWLDDEYCPEPANEEISRRCAKVYYYCLLEKQLDVGDILMQMARDLETFSFKQSFHGAYSSANAAIALITTRMKALAQETSSN